MNSLLKTSLLLLTSCLALAQADSTCLEHIKNSCMDLGPYCLSLSINPFFYLFICPFISLSFRSRPGKQYRFVMSTTYLRTNTQRNFICLKWQWSASLKIHNEVTVQFFTILVLIASISLAWLCGTVVACLLHLATKILQILPGSQK